MTMQARKTKGFITGLASVLDILPAKRKTLRRRPRYRSQAAALRGDYMAICADGAKVGRDLRSVLAKGAS